jgi:hypothetical protein
MNLSGLLKGNLPAAKKSPQEKSPFVFILPMPVKKGINMPEILVSHGIEADYISSGFLCSLILRKKITTGLNMIRIFNIFQWFSDT